MSFGSFASFKTFTITFKTLQCVDRHLEIRSCPFSRFEVVDWEFNYMKFRTWIDFYIFNSVQSANFHFMVETISDNNIFRVRASSWYGEAKIFIIITQQIFHRNVISMYFTTVVLKPWTFLWFVCVVLKKI